MGPSESAALLLRSSYGGGQGQKKGVKGKRGEIKGKVAKKKKIGPKKEIEERGPKNEVKE